MYIIYAAQPLHWVYDEAKMKQATSSCIDHPEFRTPSANPFYRRPCGSQTAYGDQIMVLLRSLVHCNGKVNVSLLSLSENGENWRYSV